MKRAAILAVLALAACGRQDNAPLQAQRISLEKSGAPTEEPLASPDTDNSRWRVADDGRAIHFGAPDGDPMLTLACRLKETPPQLVIIRHIAAQPGQKALMPVIGNGMISRFKVDASLNEGEWRWEGSFPATDPDLDVFTGRRDLEATLPGGGSLYIGGSPLPGEFVTWCRMGGRVLALEEKEAEKDASETPDP
ncbi:hypothetical protein [Altericroceibacterium endophyticum]|uniref:Lipoprotein n=1 Tax=Altericroceibacterium endophyticum TaxID=1808508 RepID=A0A6I4T3Z4_9SPHN|nr:hypothetical protein [Altericroceibacterium endophyticum]MXO64982.1 hypothetical protein [Altericroceibacterium endophyticum]